MTAKEARELAEKRQTINHSPQILKQIQAAALLGQFKLKVDKVYLNDTTCVALWEQGFKIDRNLSDTDEWDTVTW